MLAQAPPPESSENAGKDKADETAKPADQPTEEKFNIYGQTTVISDWHGTFHSPYEGEHSFRSLDEAKTSMTGTLDFGLHLWRGGEVYFDPEIAGGEGDSGVFGIGAFPNGDITRVGNPTPTPYVARLYLQQTIGFGGEEETIASGPNTLAGKRDISRLTFYLGKMAAEDFFDNNTYSHDPRVQFMNWALMYNAAWDYPADVRGYTYGGVVELNQKCWALRYGIFGEPTVANGETISPDFGSVHGQVVEAEGRYRLWDRPGKLRFMVFWNRADMGNYREATDDPAFMTDITLTRQNSIKYGFGLNLEQEISDDLGYFLRWGWNDGHTETWAFTEVDRTVSMGFSLKGTQWNRKDDTVGTGLVIDNISSAHAAYLAAGGLGFELGDGQLNRADEIAWETYYDWKFKNHQIWITPDVQFIGNPGYNADRGPLVIGALRLHAEF